MCVLLLIAGRSSPVAAGYAYCKITGVSYDYPREAQPGQRIQVKTTVNGSCVTDQMKYYSVRVDLVDLTSGNTITISSSPIGYRAENFSVTVTDVATTPSIQNASWPVQVRVYVMNAGGGGGPGGIYLIAYSSTTNATIQISPAAPVPEIPSSVWMFALVLALMSVLLVVNNGNPNLERKHTDR
jgi:hypothetical protein